MQRVRRTDVYSLNTRILEQRHPVRSGSIDSVRLSEVARLLLTDRSQRYYFHIAETADLFDVHFSHEAGAENRGSDLLHLSPFHETVKITMYQWRPAASQRTGRGRRLA